MEHVVLTMINEIIGGKGRKQYGLSAVNQRAHALGATWLTEKDGGSAAPITASLLHDIGHIVHDLGEDPASVGIDDKHEELGEAWLARWFRTDVTEPVRLHVAAKRYLCAVEPDYFAKLSSDSVRSLTLQGGPMSESEMAEYRAKQHAEAATALRRFDEGAKVEGLETPPVGHFFPYVNACLEPAGR